MSEGSIKPSKTVKNGRLGVSRKIYIREIHNSNCINCRINCPTWKKDQEVSLKNG